MGVYFLRPGILYTTPPFLNPTKYVHNLLVRSILNVSGLENVAGGMIASIGLWSVVLTLFLASCILEAVFRPTILHIAAITVNIRLTPAVELPTIAPTLEKLEPLERSGKRGNIETIT